MFGFMILVFDCYHEVGEGTIIDDSTRLYEQFKNHDKIVTLPVSSVLEAGKASLKAFDDLAKAIGSATVPFEVKTWLQKAIDAAKSLGSTMDRTEKYRKSFYNLLTDSKRAAADKKRKARSSRDAIVTVFTDSAVPKPLARRLATQIQLEAGDEEAYAATLNPWEGNVIVTEEFLREPHFIPSVKEGVAGGHMPQAIDAMLQMSVAAREVATKKTVNGMKEKGSKHGLNTFAVGAEIKWNAEGTDVLNCITDIKGYNGVMKCCVLDVRRKALPHQGLRHILTCTKGCLLVTLVPPEFFIQHQDLASFCKTAPTKALDSMDAFVLRASESLYVPFGSVPLMVGAEVEAKDAKINVKKTPRTAKRAKTASPEEPTVHYVVSLMFDKALDATYSQDLCSAVHATYSASLPYNYECVTGNAGVKAWKTAVEAIGTKQVSAED